MKNKFKSILKNYFQNNFGLDIKKYEIINKYEKLILSRMKSSKPIIFDIGAHHGAWANRIHEIFPESTVYCFEPFSKSLRCLKENLNEEWAKIYDFGISDREESVSLKINKASATNSLLALNIDAHEKWNNANIQAVSNEICKFNSLDNVIKLLNISKVDLLKIDVQGAEFKVLQGGLESIMSGKVNFILMEIIHANTYEGQKTTLEYLKLSNEYGFETLGFYDIVYGKSGEMLQFDILLQKLN